MGAFMAELLSVHELAKILRVAPMSIYRAVKSGRIPCYRVARVLRFDLSAVQSALAVNASGSR